MSARSSATAPGGSTPSPDGNDAAVPAAASELKKNITKGGRAVAQTELQRSAPPAEPIRRYAFLALAVLTASSFLNFLDRQIVSILAQAIKADLQLNDAQLGFLLGTAFAVFYAVVGIAMGRISDAVMRTRLMGAGLAIWSAMTVAGALATSFGGLAVARIGVGDGESTANPC